MTQPRDFHGDLFGEVDSESKPNQTPTSSAPLTTSKRKKAQASASDSKPKKAKNGRYSKARGDGYEREIAAHMNEALHSGEEIIRRAIMSGGGRTFKGAGDADLENTPHIWVEAKRTNTFSPYAAMAQAEKGIAAHGRPVAPVIISRRDKVPTGQSLVVMRLDDWLQLYDLLLKEKGERRSAPLSDVGPDSRGPNVGF